MLSTRKQTRVYLKNEVFLSWRIEYSIRQDQSFIFFLPFFSGSESENGFCQIFQSNVCVRYLNGHRVFVSTPLHQTLVEQQISKCKNHQIGCRSLLIFLSTVKLDEMSLWFPMGGYSLISSHKMNELESIFSGMSHCHL